MRFCKPVSTVQHLKQKLFYLSHSPIPQIMIDPITIPRPTAPDDAYSRIVVILTHHDSISLLIALDQLILGDNDDDFSTSFTSGRVPRAPRWRRERSNRVGRLRSNTAPKQCLHQPRCSAATRQQCCTSRALHPVYAEITGKAVAATNQRHRTTRRM